MKVRLRKDPHWQINTGLKNSQADVDERDRRSTILFCYWIILAKLSVVHVHSSMTLRTGL